MTKEKKLLNFLVDPDLRARIDEYCQENSMSLSNFVRLAIVEKLGRTLAPIQEVQQTQGLVREEDIQHLDLAIQSLMSVSERNQQMLEFLVDQGLQEKETPDLEEAKVILRENEPKTYEEARTLLVEHFSEDKAMTLLNDVVNSLLKSGRIQYKRKRFVWL